MSTIEQIETFPATVEFGSQVELGDRYDNNFTGGEWVAPEGGAGLIDRDLFEGWGRPGFAVDVADGAADSFSLEGSDGVYFVNRAP